MQVFQTGADRYRNASKDPYATINQRTLAFFVGLVALGLPIIMLFGVFNPYWPTCYRASISHYYYAPFLGGPFIGALVFIGTYLWVYQGEDKDGAEGRLATWAGVFAIGVALFPTSGFGCDAESFTARAMVSFGPDPDHLDLIKVPPIDGLPDLAPYFQLTTFSASVHYACAALLFSFLAWFALFVFTAVEPHQRNPDGSLKPTKIIRNSLYVACGSIMICCILGMAAYAALGAWTDLDLSWWPRNKLTFWFETVALWAFGLSWMVKGRFWGNALEDARES